MADPKKPSYPPLHFFDGAVECANYSGSDDGDDCDVRSLNPQGKADFLFCGLAPALQGDEKLGGLFSLDVASSLIASTTAVPGGVTVQ